MTSPPPAVVCVDPARARELPRALQDLDSLVIDRPGTSPVSVRDVLNATVTDAWVVLHKGAVVTERYGSGGGAERLHPLMSITKTLVGAVAGALRAEGVLDFAAPLTRYVPELGEGGYAGATVRDCLDMRSGVRFREDYDDPRSELHRMDAEGIYPHLRSLVADRPHGGPFEYRSCETDALGWVCEAASGQSMPDLIAGRIWAPMGATRDAEMVRDALGTPVHDGGMMATALDLARFGQLLLDGGARAGRQIVPSQWLAEVWAVHAELRSAYDRSDVGPFLPRGWYRNQCWVLPGPHGDLLLGLGIHGQLLRVDPATRTVVVKLSSWPAAQNPQWLVETLRACDAVVAAVSGRRPRAADRSSSAQAGPSPTRFH
jgi:CubicO group peptidase (beta-lactamase class C family)